MQKYKNMFSKLNVSDLIMYRIIIVKGQYFILPTIISTEIQHYKLNVWYQINIIKN